MQILYLLPDTNIFIQCKPLEELDWSAWAEFDEVHLVVCRPVQREIDDQKNRGNDRIGKQARRAHSVFKDIITGADEYKLIQKSAPQVKLKVEVRCIPSPKLKDQLDYDKPDDQLVGCLYAYHEAYPEVDARLLTNDSGPMATAKMLSLPFAVVPDNWLKPPESTTGEREKNRLETELSRLKKAEPAFRISCLGDRDNETNPLIYEYIRYEPLTDDYVADLMERLRINFPLATNFGSRGRVERHPSTLSLAIGMKEVYTPASDEDIAAYTDKKYPAWLEKCEDILKNFHNFFQSAAGQPGFCFVATNEGSRPGKDVLIIFEAKGKFQICPPPQTDQDEEREYGTDDEENIFFTEIPELPPPPTPPCGKWNIDFVEHADSLFRGLFSGLLNQSNSLMGIYPNPTYPIIPSELPKHDPNEFYYKDRGPITPAASFGLKCDQWRHSSGEEFFSGEIFFDTDIDEIHGALECLIHAENLSDPTKKVVPVKITIKPTSVRNQAKALVNRLTKRTGGT